MYTAVTLLLGAQLQSFSAVDAGQVPNDTLNYFAHYNPLHGVTATSTELGDTVNLQGTGYESNPPASSQLEGHAVERRPESNTSGSHSKANGDTATPGKSIVDLFLNMKLDSYKSRTFCSTIFDANSGVIVGNNQVPPDTLNYFAQCDPSHGITSSMTDASISNVNTTAQPITPPASSQLAGHTAAKVQDIDTLGTLSEVGGDTGTVCTSKVFRPLH